MVHDSKAEVWDFTCNSISANKWPFVEDGGRVGRSGVPIWRFSFLVLSVVIFTIGCVLIFTPKIRFNHNP